MKTIILAHYYTTPEVQKMADFVGDSLELALRAREARADRIVFAGVRFMAETAKILNPKATVILPNAGSSCSLVDQVDQKKIRKQIYNVPINTEVVTYINSSADLKAISDWIVTSRNVEEIIQNRIESGKRIFFTPDRNMGAYFKFIHPEWGDKFSYYKDAVCIVHDKFKEEEIDKAFKHWTDGNKYLLAHPESPLPVLKRANMVGSTSKMLKWVENFEGSIGSIFVATEDGLIHNMRKVRPDLDIKQLGNYNGCQCNSCPFMKMNTEELVYKAAVAGLGEVIKLSPTLIYHARYPIEKMIQFNQGD